MSTQIRCWAAFSTQAMTPVESDRKDISDYDHAAVDSGPGKSSELRPVSQ